MSNVIGTLSIVNLDGSETVVGDVTGFSFTPAELKLPEGEYYYNFSGWGTDYYELTVAEINEVILNGND